jgi:hypothetical protein
MRNKLLRLYTLNYFFTRAELASFLPGYVLTTCILYCIDQKKFTVLAIGHDVQPFFAEKKIPTAYLEFSNRPIVKKFEQKTVPSKNRYYKHFLCVYMHVWASIQKTFLPRFLQKFLNYKNVK